MNDRQERKRIKSVGKLQGGIIDFKKKLGLHWRCSKILPPPLAQRPQMCMECSAWPVGEGGLHGSLHRPLKIECAIRTFQGKGDAQRHRRAYLSTKPTCNTKPRALKNKAVGRRRNEGKRPIESGGPVGGGGKKSEPVAERQLWTIGETENP